MLLIDACDALRDGAARLLGDQGFFLLIEVFLCVVGELLGERVPCEFAADFTGVFAGEGDALGLRSATAELL